MKLYPLLDKNIIWENNLFYLLPIKLQNLGLIRVVVKRLIVVVTYR